MNSVSERHTEATPAAVFSGMKGFFDPDSRRLFREPDGQRLIVIAFDRQGAGNTRMPAVIRETGFPEFARALSEQRDGEPVTVHGLMGREWFELTEAGLRQYRGIVHRIETFTDTEGTPYALGILRIGLDDAPAGGETAYLPFRAYGEDALAIARMEGGGVALNGHLTRDDDGRPCFIAEFYEDVPAPERVADISAEP